MVTFIFLTWTASDLTAVRADLSPPRLRPLPSVPPSPGVPAVANLLPQGFSFRFHVNHEQPQARQAQPPREFVQSDSITGAHIRLAIRVEDSAGQHARVHCRSHAACKRAGCSSLGRMVILAICGGRYLSRRL